MAINIRTINLNGVYYENGNGTPTHISGKGTVFTNLDDGVLYVNKDGVSQWAVILDSISFTGGTSGSTGGGTSISGFTYDNANTLSIIDATGGTFSTSINVMTGLTVNGSISATTFYGDGSNLSGISTTDIYVTGGTYSSGTATFTNNSGATFNVSDFISANTFTTGTTFNPANYDLISTRNDGVNYTVNLGLLASDITITGGTYNINTGVVTFTNNTGGTFSVSGFSSGMTDTTITSFTYNNANSFNITDTSGGTFNASINIVTGLTVNGTISATTYQNLPTDIYVTGGTFNNINNNATFTNNSGGTFNVNIPPPVSPASNLFLYYNFS
jgi:hypothetical protein